jgi:peptidoglycan/LPS O-acetylase OafA/YrhL
MASVRFGEVVEGYAVPVLNEREIRAAAGILFVATFLSLLFILFDNNFIPIKFVIPVFLADILVRVFVSPRFSPTLIVGRLIVGNQTPEYVAAEPKRLAWMIGIALASMMFVLMVVMNTYSIITGLTCLVCLIFLFFEAAFGICLGCKFYKLVYRREPQLCPGEVCDVRTRDPITRTSVAQVLVVVATIALVVAAAFTLTETFAKPARALFPEKAAASAKH